MTSIISTRAAGPLAAGVLLLLAMLAAPAVWAGPQHLRDGLAIGGYDAVGYFTEDRAVKGRADFAYEWNGAAWHFASAGNRDQFAADPTAYAPRYDGFCAYAAAQGAKADGDPEVWRIVDGKLYLNVSHRVQRRWERDIPGYVAKADAVWPSVNS